jgi:hypothetical protein
MKPHRLEWPCPAREQALLDGDFGSAQISFGDLINVTGFLPLPGRRVDIRVTTEADSFHAALSPTRLDEWPFQTIKP